MTEEELKQLAAKARELYNSLSPEDRAHHDRMQQMSWVRGMTARCEHGVTDFEQCPKCRDAARMKRLVQDANQASIFPSVFKDVQSGRLGTCEHGNPDIECIKCAEKAMSKERSANPPESKLEWKDKSTAPMDGTVILASFYGSNRVPRPIYYDISRQRWMCAIIRSVLNKVSGFVWTDLSWPDTEKEPKEKSVEDRLTLLENQAKNLHHELSELRAHTARYY